MNFEEEIDRLKETLVIVGETQRQLAQVQRMQAESLVLHEQRMNQTEAYLAEVAAGLAALKTHLAEVTDKLDGLIGFMDGYFRRPQ